MPAQVQKCFGCSQMTPAAQGACIYCGRPLARPRPRRRPPKRPAPAPAGACGRCGAAAPAGARDCAACQGPLTEGREHFLVVDARPPVRLEPGTDFVIGRDADVDLTAYAADVSRQHAVIRWDAKEPPRPKLTELRGTNGTWLNERPIPPRTPVRLCSGDAIRLGETFRVLYYHLSPTELRREIELRGALETRRYSTDARPAPSVRPPGA